MRNFQFSLCLLISFLIFIGCKKKEQVPNQSTVETVSTASPLVDEVGLEDDEYQLWKSFPVDTVWNTSELTTIDGENLETWSKTHALTTDKNVNDLKSHSDGTSQNTSTGEKIKLLISRCKKAAFNFALRSPNEQEFHSKFPNIINQNRLAYVWAASEVQNQHVCNEDSKRKDCGCSTPLFGLDCSGFIYQVFDRDVGLPIGRLNTAGFSNIDAWNNALDNSQYSGIKVEDVSSKITTIYDCLEGDIIVRAGHHMGIVLDNLNGRKVLNSFGKPQNSCDANSDIEHGPVAMDPLNKNFKGLFSAFPTSYKVFRFVNPKSEYTLGATMRIALTFLAGDYAPHYAFSEYFMTASVYDSKGNTVPGVTIQFSSNWQKYQRFDHPSALTPNAQDRFYTPSQAIPVILVSATMPDGTFMQESFQPKFDFVVNQPPIIVGSTPLKSISSITSKVIN